MSLLHETFMKRCIELAKKGTGFVSPNPLVGSVIVKDGKIISEGWHKAHGEIHAEAMALSEVNSSELNGATLYCTLEPCSHSSKEKINPPCARTIAEFPFKEIVIGMVDPNPAVSGNGIRLLESAGIKVTTGILEAVCRELNPAFITHIQKKRPFIRLKSAQTLDGFIATSTGKSKWITSELSRTRVHEYRAELDAVLIGADTAIADNPTLNVRLVKGRNPKRIVIDSKGRTPLDLNLYTDELRSKTIVCVGRNCPEEFINSLQKQDVTILLCEEINGYLNLKNVISRLYKNGIYSILVEGGQKLTSIFLKEKLFDEWCVMVSPKVFGTGLSVLNDIGVDNVADAIELKNISTEMLGNEILIKGVNDKCLLD